MQRSWKSDRRLIALTVLMLTLEVAWLLMHLELIASPFHRGQTDKLEQMPAGSIVKVQRDLRKRSLNSLIWEDASEDETLYYYDSVLTLGQSTATLYLREQTEVHLSENTLVTIEPQSAANTNEIRLKFTRGDLRARNPYTTAKIETTEWSLNLNQGSEVSLRQTGSNDFEVEVLKGNLEFQKDSGTQSLGENQLLKIENNKVAETVAIEDSIKFEGPDYQRIYSYQPEAIVPVEWTGKAESIQILPVGKDKVLKTLTQDQTKDQLALEPGKYTLRLLKDGKVSEAKEIEVWRAPNLHLLSPFPRDRVKTNENVSFIWTYLPEAKEYKFVITDLRTGKRLSEKRVQENSFSYKFEDESEVQWQVIGIDLEGFEMPAPYANEIYPRHEPFAAPKLKSPEVRVPASKPRSESSEKNSDSAKKSDAKKKAKKKKGASVEPNARSSLWSLIWKTLVTQATAAESKSSDAKATAGYEAVFAWEPVEGADTYTIEISDTSDFLHPKLSKTLKKTEFIWSQFPLGTYFWRVAAGSSKGRMGVFSEPAIVKLEKLPENSSGSSDNDGVLIRKKIDPDKDRAPVETKTEVIFKDVPKPQFDEKVFDKEVRMVSDDQRELKDTYLFEWSPLWTTYTLNGEDQLKAKMNGQTTGAGHFQTEQIRSKDQSFLIDAFYAQYKWKAADISQYPFQEDQSLTDGRVQILFGNSKSGLLRGGIVQTLPSIERQDLEKIEIKSKVAVGPSVLYNWTHSEKFLSGHSLSFTAGSQVFGFSTQNSFRYLYYKGESSALSIGFRIQADVIFDKRSFSNGWSTGLSLGFEN
jgi:hypothetical protein